MKNNFKIIKFCRICGSNSFFEYLNLGKQPLANSFIKRNEIKYEKKFPLKMILCKKCGLSFLSISVNPNLMFKNYDYLSSSSRALIDHYKKLTDSLIIKFKLNKNDKILDIGCNDGVLLNRYPDNYCNLIGVEPSTASKLLNLKKIRLYKNFFNYNYSKKIKKEIGCPKIITITNVFAHIDDIKDFVRGLSNISNKETVIVIEFPYLIDMINKNYYDLIYHEHVSYLSLHPLRFLFDKFNMQIFKYEKFDIGASGPSLRIFVSMKNSNFNVSKLLLKQIIFEKNWKLLNKKPYILFNEKVKNHKLKLLKLINKLIQKNNNIGCFSAPAKGNTLLNYLNISNKIIKYVSENNKRKIGKYTPGTHYKIITDKEFLSKNISYAILLSWNYKKFFIKNSEFIKKNNHFIIPMPKPHIKK